MNLDLSTGSDAILSYLEDIFESGSGLYPSYNEETHTYTFEYTGETVNLVPTGANSIVIETGNTRYKLSCWNYQGNSTSSITSLNGISSDVTLVPIWEPSARKYTVSLMNISDMFDEDDDSDIVSPDGCLQVLIDELTEMGLSQGGSPGTEGYYGYDNDNNMLYFTTWINSGGNGLRLPVAFKNTSGAYGYYEFGDEPATMGERKLKGWKTLGSDTPVYTSITTDIGTGSLNLEPVWEVGTKMTIALPTPIPLRNCNDDLGDFDGQENMYYCYDYESDSNLDRQHVLPSFTNDNVGQNGYFAQNYGGSYKLYKNGWTILKQNDSVKLEHTYITLDEYNSNKNQYGYIDLALGKEVEDVGVIAYETNEDPYLIFINIDTDISGMSIFDEVSLKGIFKQDESNPGDIGYTVSVPLETESETLSLYDIFAALNGASPGNAHLYPAILMVGSEYGTTLTSNGEVNLVYTTAELISEGGTTLPYKNTDGMLNSTIPATAGSITFTQLEGTPCKYGVYIKTSESGNDIDYVGTIQYNNLTNGYTVTYLNPSTFFTMNTTTGGIGISTTGGKLIYEVFIKMTDDEG